MSEHLKSIESAILMHALKFSKMRPRDAVKLVYQACFGPGHLISDEKKAYDYLVEEYGSTRQRDTAPLVEPIGAGMIRINLAALVGNNVELDRVFEAFLASSKAEKLGMDDFLEALELLKRLCREGIFRFDINELEEYLESYKEQGYPAVSHSEEYKEAYEPAYRVAREELFKR